MEPWMPSILDSASCNASACTRASSDWNPGCGTCPWCPSRACHAGTWRARACFWRSSFRVLASAFLAVTFRGAAFLAAVFFAAVLREGAFFAGTFLAAAFFAVAFLGAAFLAAVFLPAVFLAAVFFGAAFFAGFFLAAVFFVVAMLPPGLAAAAAFMAGVPRPAYRPGERGSAEPRAEQPG